MLMEWKPLIPETKRLLHNTQGMILNKHEISQFCKLCTVHHYYTTLLLHYYTVILHNYYTTLLHKPAFHLISWT